MISQNQVFNQKTQPSPGSKKDQKSINVGFFVWPRLGGGLDRPIGCFPSASHGSDVDVKVRKLAVLDTRILYLVGIN